MHSIFYFAYYNKSAIGKLVNLYTIDFLGSWLEHSNNNPKIFQTLFAVLNSPIPYWQHMLIVTCSALLASCKIQWHIWLKFCFISFFNTLSHYFCSKNHTYHNKCEYIFLSWVDVPPEAGIAETFHFAFFQTNINCLCLQSIK